MTTQRVWLTPAGHERLQQELHTLQELVNAATDEDANTLDVQRARQARIHEIHELLGNAVVGEDPPDDGIAEPGMVLTVSYDDDPDDTETFLLGVRGAEVGDLEVYSVDSPLGTAIAGARPGETRTYQVPSGATVQVTLVSAVPYGMHHPTVAG
ncbi:GreA/GreB family elongation factor [Mycolicibacterium thermoresistibile]